MVIKFPQPVRIRRILKEMGYEACIMVSWRG